MTQSYQFWTLYFEEEPEIAIQSTIAFFTTHFRESISNCELERIKESQQFIVPYSELMHLLSTKVSNIEQIIAKEINLEDKYNFSLLNILTSISCSITNLINQPIRIGLKIIDPDFYTPLDILNEKSINKLVNIKGTIIKSEPKNMAITKLIFECSQCKEIVKITASIYKTPNKCKNNCKYKLFKLIETNQSIHPTQNLILKNKKIEIKIQLNDFLVNQAQCGDMVEVLGCLLAEQLDNKRYQMYIKVFNLTRLNELSEYVQTKIKNEEVLSFEIEKFICKRNQEELLNQRTKNIFKNQDSSSLNNINLSNEDFFNDLLQMNVHNLSQPSFNHESNSELFNKLFKNTSEKEIISSIINSLFPQIFGNEIIKLAITFSMFGGSIKHCNAVKLRNSINTLIVGLTGLGKTLFLQSIANFFPKSIYTDSLKNTFFKETIFNEYFLEANSILQSNNSICCIDNFKQPNLIENINEQNIKLNTKFNSTIPINTTIIGASNPKDYKKNYLFDIIILINDELNEQLSKQVSDHILIPKKVKENENINELLDLIKSDPFIYNLKCSINTKLINQNDLLNYILYGRERIHPLILPQAFNKLKEFYLSNKLQLHSYEALVKICEARAKLVHRSTANLEDAIFTIQFFKKIMKMENRKTEKKGFKAFFECLKDKSVVTYKEIESIVGSKLENKTAGQVINSLNNQGVLIKVSKDEYKINHSAFS